MKTDRPVIGVDVGKGQAWYAFLKPDGELFGHKFSATSDAAGFATVFEKIEQITKAFGIKPALVLESTGHYSARLAEMFIRNNLCTVFLINPLQSHSIKSSRIRKVKTDKTDCEDLARLYYLMDLREYELADDNTLDLKLLCRTMRQLSKQRVKLLNQLTGALEQSWPGYLKVMNSVVSLTSMAVLERYPDPQSLIDAEPDEVAVLIAKQARRSFSYAESKYQQLKDSAVEALFIGINRSANTAVVKVYRNALCQINSAIYELQKQIDQLVTVMPQTKLLMTIPGIGPKLAAVIASEIGDINRFDNYKQLVAYCGIEPRVFQSGNFTGTHNKMTKRGSPYLRRAIFLAAAVAIRKDHKGNLVNSMMYEYYHKKTQSKAKKQALGAIMNKLVRIIFSVLKNQKPFVLPQLPKSTISSDVVAMKVA